MEKNTTLSLRVNPILKHQAEDVLKRLGVPMSTAVDMYLHQIVLTGGIPFLVSLPKTSPESINADTMTTETLHRELMAGYEDMKEGRVHDASEVFASFRREHL